MGDNQEGGGAPKDKEQATISIPPTQQRKDSPSERAGISVSQGVRAPKDSAGIAIPSTTPPPESPGAAGITVPSVQTPGAPPSAMPSRARIAPKSDYRQVVGPQEEPSGQLPVQPYEWQNGSLSHNLKDWVEEALKDENRQEARNAFESRRLIQWLISAGDLIGIELLGGIPSFEELIKRGVPGYADERRGVFKGSTTATFVRRDYIEPLVTKYNKFSKVLKEIDVYREFLDIAEMVTPDVYEFIRSEELQQRINHFKQLIEKLQSHSGLGHAYPKLIEMMGAIEGLLGNNETRAKLNAYLKSEYFNRLKSLAVDELLKRSVDDSKLDWGEQLQVKRDVRFNAFTAGDWDEVILKLRKNWKNQWRTELPIQSEREFLIEQQDGKLRQYIEDSDNILPQNIYLKYLNNLTDIFQNKKEAEAHLSQFIATRKVKVGAAQGAGWSPCRFFGNATGIEGIHKAVLQNMELAAGKILDPAILKGYFNNQPDGEMYTAAVDEVIKSHESHGDEELVCWEFLWRTGYKNLHVGPRAAQTVTDLINLLDANADPLIGVIEKGLLELWCRHAIENEKLTQEATQAKEGRVRGKFSGKQTCALGWLWAAGEKRLVLDEGVSASSLYDFIKVVTTSASTFEAATSALLDGRLGLWLEKALGDVTSSGNASFSAKYQGALKDFPDNSRLWVFLWRVGFRHYHVPNSKSVALARNDLVAFAEDEWDNLVAGIADQTLLEWFKFVHGETSLYEDAAKIAKNENNNTKALNLLLYASGFSKLRLGDHFIAAPFELFRNENQPFMGPVYDDGSFHLWLEKGLHRDDLVEILSRIKEFPRVMHHVYWKLGGKTLPETPEGVEIASIDDYVTFNDRYPQEALKLIDSKLVIEWLENAFGMKLTDDPAWDPASAHRGEILARILGAVPPQPRFDPPEWDLGEIQEGTNRNVAISLMTKGKRGYLFGNISVQGDYLSTDTPSINRLEYGQQQNVGLSVSMPIGGKTGFLEGRLIFSDGVHSDQIIGTTAEAKISWRTAYPFNGIALTTLFIGGLAALLLFGFRLLGMGAFENDAVTFFTDEGFVNENLFSKNAGNALNLFLACISLCFTLLTATRLWQRNIAQHPYKVENENRTALLWSLSIFVFMISTIGFFVIKMSFIALNFGDSFASGLTRALFGTTISGTAVSASWILLVLPLAFGYGCFMAMLKYRRRIQGLLLVFCSMIFLVLINSYGMSNQEYANLVSNMSAQPVDVLKSYMNDPVLKKSASVAYLNIIVKEGKECETIQRLGEETGTIPKGYVCIASAMGDCWLPTVGDCWLLQKNTVEAEKVYRKVLEKLLNGSTDNNTIKSEYSGIIKIFRDNGVPQLEAKWLLEMAERLTVNNDKLKAYLAAAQLFWSNDDRENAAKGFNEALKINYKATLKDPYFRDYMKEVSKGN